MVSQLLLSIYGHSPSCKMAPNVWNTQQSSSQPKTSLAGSWCSSPSRTGMATPLAAHSLALVSPCCWGELAVTAAVLTGTWELPQLQHVSQQAFTWGCCSCGELQLRGHLAWQVAGILLPQLSVTNVMASWRSCFLPHFFPLPTELAAMPSLLRRHSIVALACGEVACMAWSALQNQVLLYDLCLLLSPAMTCLRRANAPSELFLKPSPRTFPALSRRVLRAQPCK